MPIQGTQNCACVCTATAQASLCRNSFSNTDFDAIILNFGHLIKNLRCLPGKICLIKRNIIPIALYTPGIAGINVDFDIFSLGEDGLGDGRTNKDENKDNISNIKFLVK